MEQNKKVGTSQSNLIELELRRQKSIIFNANCQQVKNKTLLHPFLFKTAIFSWKIFNTTNNRVIKALLFKQRMNKKALDMLASKPSYLIWSSMCTAKKLQHFVFSLIYDLFL